MKEAIFIIQGSGKGHFSQALTRYRQLTGAGVRVSRIYVGRSLMQQPPAYFHTAFPLQVTWFRSPDFISRADRRGIRVGCSLLVNLLVSPLYLYSFFRLRRRLRRSAADAVFNFYDPVGALVCRWPGRRLERIAVGHHFYLAHPAFSFPSGFPMQRRLLRLMNRLMMHAADRVEALSFRHAPPHEKIRVLPPLVHPALGRVTYAPGERDLCYFLTPGYVNDYLAVAGTYQWKADIFTAAVQQVTRKGNVTLYPPSLEGFREKLSRCRRLVTTGGFETVAEALFLGVPVFILPARGHYEQLCNAVDAEETGLAVRLTEMGQLAEAREVVAAGGALERYREWVEFSGSNN